MWASALICEFGIRWDGLACDVGETYLSVVSVVLSFTSPERVDRDNALFVSLKARKALSEVTSESVSISLHEQTVLT